ncbi:WD40 repeat domain-containing protein [Phytomonospora endophytica]|uniref:WD40 repeat protein n=1 Tax=Phytomonospora endophytica TaxID=714109 RepID=A0A841FPU3_9ACTN|nr:WD40 repeat domain-containing protein [Phytomonospora endophytica]MBB6035287.1 WD40 repeat protein [Phytomonospora endophytica]GIG63964.1 hypothetical protein Pen01_02590 [Phytomonospora endophytica]
MLVSAQIPSDTSIADVSFVRHDGIDLVVCADRWGALWTWSPSTGEWDQPNLGFAHASDPVMRPYPDATNEFDMIAAASVGGRLLLAGGGDEQEPALWDFTTGEVVARAPVTGAYLSDVVAHGGRFYTAEQYSEEVRLWTPGVRGDAVAEVGSLFCLATARVGGRDLLLAGGEGVVVHTADTHVELASFAPYDGRVWGVTACEANERSLIIGVTENGRLCVWDLDDGGEEEIYEPVTATEGSLENVEVLTVGGRPLAVTPADGGGLRLWDVTDGSEAGHVEASGHGVTAMETASADGRTVLVTGGFDGVVRLWEASDLTQ